MFIFLPSRALNKAFFLGNIDQVFSSNVKVLGVLDMPYKDPSQFEPIPGPVWPSDHLCLGVDIDLI